MPYAMIVAYDLPERQENLRIVHFQPYEPCQNGSNSTDPLSGRGVALVQEDHMARRIKHACIKRLALCKAGKNGLKTLFKSDGTAEWATLCKGDPEKGELLAVAYPLDMQDDDGDFADTMAAIESMAHSFMQNGAALDIEHDGVELTTEQAFVKESFIIQPDDARFKEWPGYDGTPVDVTGGWAVKLQIDDPELRDAYRAGEWDGVSLFGPAAVEQVDLKAASKRVAARMGGTTENDMNDKELQAALAAHETKIADLVKSAVESALKPQVDADAEAKAKAEVEAKAKADAELQAPTFTGDPLDADALAAYETSLRGFELRKAIASGEMTADKLAELRKSLTEKLPTTDELVESGIPAEEGDSAEVRKLQVQLFKARKGSNAPERKDGGTDESAEDVLAKAHTDEGLAIAELVNEITGSFTPEMRVVSKG